MKHKFYKKVILLIFYDFWIFILKSLQFRNKKELKNYLINNAQLLIVSLMFIAIVFAIKQVNILNILYNYVII